MKKNFITTILLGCISCIGFSQKNIDKIKLDKYFDTLDSNNKFMGSVVVSKKGEVIYSKNIGFMDVENNIKSNLDSKYRIGSITKTFTAVLILKAFEEKKLNISETIDKWFPSIKTANLITVENLLNHRSGIADITDNLNYTSFYTKSKTEEEIIEIIANDGIKFEPNSKAEYSNSNYLLLSYIIEKVYNKTYEQVLIEYITTPIGLMNTYVFDKINTNKNEANSYIFTDKWIIQPETNYSICLGAGAIVSTAFDLIKFNDALFNEKILKKETVKLMTTLNENYGMGLFQFPFDKFIGYGHLGGIDGFSSLFAYFPESKVSYVLLSNGTNIDINNISLDVLSEIFNKPYDIPIYTNYSVNSQSLKQYLGNYISDQNPLEITVSQDNNILVAQATGQSALRFEAFEENKFTHGNGKIVLEFKPNEKVMILKQNGREFMFYNQKVR